MQRNLAPIGPKGIVRVLRDYWRKTISGLPSGLMFA